MKNSLPKSRATKCFRSSSALILVAYKALISDKRPGANNGAADESVWAGHPEPRRSPVAQLLPGLEQRSRCGGRDGVRRGARHSPFPSEPMAPQDALRPGLAQHRLGRPLPVGLHQGGQKSFKTKVNLNATP